MQSLYLADTCIHRLPICLSHLKKLEYLNLFHLHLHHLPSWVMNIGSEFIFDENYHETGVRLNSTTLSTQPISLFHQPRELIQAYFDAPKIPVNEGKVIFLGHGDVGKSYTIQRIRNNDERADYDTSMTPGISITSHPVEYQGRRFDIRFWDFGGQDAMHAMHRCFLTQRTCYVVMVSNRLPDLDGQARYWLRNIESFAPGSEVLLVVNRWEDYPYNGDLNTNQLHQDFPNLVNCVTVSAKCDSKEKFHALLTEELIQMAAKLDSTGMDFPEQWYSIRQELLSMADNGEYYINQQKYHEICGKYGLDDPNIRMWLLEWFNDLGTCFSYHQDTEKKELKEYKILNPGWLTNAIYLLILNGRKYTDNGIIKHSGVSDLLENPKGGTVSGLTYSPAECGYILEVMRKFRLSFAVSGTEEFIPALCPNQTPTNLIPAEYKEHLGYELEYTYLPDTVVHQLMIFCYRQLKLDRCWQKGMTIEIPLTGLSAIVRMDSDRPVLKLDVYSDGTTPMWRLLQSLLHAVGEINTRLNLKAVDYVCLEKDGRSERFEMERILEIRKRSSILQGKKTDYSISDILNHVYGPGVVEQTEQALKKESETHLTPPAITNYVFDHCGTVVLGENHIQTVTETTVQTPEKPQPPEQSIGKAASDRLQDAANISAVVSGLAAATDNVKGLKKLFKAVKAVIKLIIGFFI